MVTFSKLLSCIPDLRELNVINMRRTFRDAALDTSEYNITQNQGIEPSATITNLTSAEDE